VSHSSLISLPDPALWTSRTWADLAQLRAPAKHLVVLPLFGFADWGLGRPLDLEETLGTSVLRVALAQPVVKKLPILVLPPLRWVLGPYPHSIFGVDYETAHDLLREIAASVHAAGFRKLILFNSSPWNEELIDVAGRDGRVALGLQVFGVNLAALDLDLHPVRSATRVGVQCAACACYGVLPADDRVPQEIIWSDFRPGHIRQPGAVPFEHSLDAACREGEEIVAAAGRKLAGLFSETAARAALPLEGRIPSMRPPKTKSRSISKSRRKR
jgi:creatinine amidohydrolase